jgi:hypothetical protein
VPRQPHRQRGRATSTAYAAEERFWHALTSVRLSPHHRNLSRDLVVLFIYEKYAPSHDRDGEAGVTQESEHYTLLQCSTKLCSCVRETTML